MADPPPPLYREVGREGGGLQSIFVFMAGIAIGAVLHAAIRPAIRKLCGGHLLGESETIADEATGMDIPGE
jgi:hypothetical protein